MFHVKHSEIVSNLFQKSPLCHDFFGTRAVVFAFFYMYKSYRLKSNFVVLQTHY